jgi:diketogulonate reductase-like aldo/keto reductase
VALKPGGGFDNVPQLDTWRAMENLVKEGKIRSIGMNI